jgi:membrane fusion protein (multidrug efflux system)
MLLLAVADGAVYYILANRNSQSTDEASVDCDQIIVRAQIFGQIAGLAKDEHASVAKDDVLVTLDDQSLENALRQALADKDIADRNVTLVKLRLGQATSDLQRAEAQLQNKVIPQKQYDDQVSEKSYAEVQLGIAQALARLFEVNVATAKSNLERAVIKSPITGVVAKKWVAIGDTVQPAQAMYTLSDIKNLWVSANFTRKQATRIAIGDSAEITVDAFPGKMFTGKVVAVGTETTSQSSFMPLDTDSGSFTKLEHRGTVTIYLDNDNSLRMDPGKTLLPGMTAKVRVTTRR